VREGSSAEPRDGWPPSDDAAILRQIARGDLSGFDAFVGRYRAKLMSYAYQRVGDLHRAEDIAQEVFLRAFRAAADGGFRGKGSARPWPASGPAPAASSRSRCGRRTSCRSAMI